MCTEQLFWNHRKRKCLASGRPQSRLQTGTHGALGKPSGTVARVHVGEVIMPIHTKLQNEEHVVKALCRAKFRFPGRQDICISKEWGFTKCNADESEAVVAEKWLIPDGSGMRWPFQIGICLRNLNTHLCNKDTDLRRTGISIKWWGCLFLRENNQFFVTDLMKGRQAWCGVLLLHWVYFYYTKMTSGNIMHVLHPNIN